MRVGEVTHRGAGKDLGICIYDAGKLTEKHDEAGRHQCHVQHDTRHADISDLFLVECLGPVRFDFVLQYAGQARRCVVALHHSRDRAITVVHTQIVPADS